MPDDIAESATPSTEPSQSPAPAVETSAPTSTPQGDQPAGDSGQSAKDTLLDAVLKVVPATNEQDVLKEAEAKASPDAPTEKPEDGQAEADAAEGEDDTELKTEEADALVRKKFNRLLRQRVELKKQLQQWEAVRPQAEIGVQLETLAKENDLSGDDIAKGLSIMVALRHGDYAKFYESISPFVRQAQEYLGIALPADVRQRVSQGQMTEDTARQLVRQNMDLQRAEMARTAEQQVFAQRTLQQTQSTVEQSVNALEARIAANDPDYKAKQASVRRTAQAMLLERGGHINSAQEALEITQAAYAEVNASLKKFRPQVHATSPVPNGNGSTRSARAEPATLMEAALQGLERARNGTAA